MPGEGDAHAVEDFVVEVVGAPSGGGAHLVGCEPVAGVSDVQGALAATASAHELQRANPDFAPREHPDLDSWMTGGTWGGTLPVEPETFVQALIDDPEAPMDDLLARDYSERNFGQPDWRDALTLIRLVAETRPDLGDQIWTLVDARRDLGSKAIDLQEAIVEGWGRADLGDSAATAADRVATLVASQHSARSVGAFLLGQIRTQVDSDETPTLAAMRKIASELWHDHGAAFRHSEHSDVVSMAPLYLNSWPVELAQYWMSEVDRRWRKHRSDWSGLNDEERSALSRLLNGPPDARDATQPALAHELFFMFAADPDFTTSRLLPLFRDDATAKLAWTPYLRNVRYNDKMLATGLLAGVLAEWGRLAELGGHGLKPNFFGLVASIISLAGITSQQRQELLDRSVLADDGAHAAGFAEAVARLIRAEKLDGSVIWDHWLRNHLAARIDGIPRTASAEELARWSDVVPYLGPSIDHALALVERRGIELGEDFRVPAFPDGVLATNGSALVRHYIERVRNSTPSGHLAGYQVRKLIDTLRSALGEGAVEELVAAAIERGFIPGDGE